MSEDGSIRVWGPVTRAFLDVFSKYKDEEDRVPLCNVRKACNELSLYPSISQVHEMVNCAVEYGSPCEPGYITYGEFCVLVAELQMYYSLHPEAPQPVSLMKPRVDQFYGKRKKRVFLGGSCNPTSWRADIAIPFLKENGITFYNPQVQCWKQELMELEEQAKQTAEVLFFVIDSKTRAIASMIEVSYLIACRRQVIVMMFDYKEQKVSIGGRDLSNNEITDISRGRLILTDLVERNSVPIFSKIEQALQCTKLVLRRGIKVQDLTLKDGAQPVKYGFLKLGEALLQLREAFNSVDNKCAGYLSSKDVCLAYKSCTGEELDVRWLRSRCRNKDQYIFEEFCGIVTEYRQQFKQGSCQLLAKECAVGAGLPLRRLGLARNSMSPITVHSKNGLIFCVEEQYINQSSSSSSQSSSTTTSPSQSQTPTFLEKLLHHVLTPIKWLITKFSTPPPPLLEPDPETIRDIYLGGSCGKTTWRSHIAIPLLRKHGLSFIDPTVNQWDQKLIPMHVSLRERCRLLLYVITGQTRGLCSMLEAGYYIGKSCRLVLCVQKMKSETMIGDEKISECAVKDYNRGRDYLSDLASREGIQLFDDVTEAVNCAIFLLTGENIPPSSSSANLL